MNIPHRYQGMYCVVIAALVGSSSTGALATPVSIPLSSVIQSVENSSVNTVGTTPGITLLIGANQVTPNALGGTSGIAQTINTSTGTTVTRTLVNAGNIAFPNQFTTRVNDQPGLRNPWTLTFSNGPDTTVVSTASLVGINPIPFATDVLITPGTNPTFTWTTPSVIDSQFINIFDHNILNASGGPNIVLNMGISKNATSFTVPTVLGGGLTLDPTHVYTIQIGQTKSFDPTQPTSRANQAATSRSNFDFTVLPSGSSAYIPMVDPVTGVFHFDITVVQGQIYNIDPLLAVGYDYQIGAGDPNFASVTLPTGIGDNVYDLFLFDTGLNDYVDSGIDLTGGIEHTFAGPGVDRFRILGIETSAGLDPNDATAFVTGLTFTGTGRFTGTMTPITLDVPDASAPLPGSLALLGMGLGILGWSSRRK